MTEGHSIRIGFDQNLVQIGAHLFDQCLMLFLEDQIVSIDEQQKMLEDKVDDLTRDIPSDFWSNKS